MCFFLRKGELRRIDLGKHVQMLFFVGNQSLWVKLKFFQQTKEHHQIRNGNTRWSLLPMDVAYWFKLQHPWATTGFEISWNTSINRSFWLFETCTLPTRTHSNIWKMNHPCLHEVWRTAQGKWQKTLKMFVDLCLDLSWTCADENKIAIGGGEF